jgi:dephospho-CoA kinase
MIVIGLTGGIASGKSTVAKVLKEWGVFVIDADKVAREVIEPGTKAWQELVVYFGKEILNEDRTINRRKLGQIVFGNYEKLSILNEITHPPLLKEIRDRIEKFEQQYGEKGVLVLDAPLLLEMNMEDWVDQVWLVVVDKETQVQRVMKRDGITREEALERIEAQMPTSEKMKYAHVIINNTETEEQMRNQLKIIWEKWIEPLL